MVASNQYTIQTTNGGKNYGKLETQDLAGRVRVAWFNVDSPTTATIEVARMESGTYRILDAKTFAAADADIESGVVSVGHKDLYDLRDTKVTDKEPSTTSSIVGDLIEAGRDWILQINSTSTITRGYVLYVKD